MFMCGMPNPTMACLSNFGTDIYSFYRVLATKVKQELQSVNCFKTTF